MQPKANSGLITAQFYGFAWCVLFPHSWAASDVWRGSSRLAASWHAGTQHGGWTWGMWRRWGATEVTISSRATFSSSLHARFWGLEASAACSAAAPPPVPGQAGAAPPSAASGEEDWARQMWLLPCTDGNGTSRNFTLRGDRRPDLFLVESVSQR